MGHAAGQRRGFHVFAIRYISHENRRRVLERLFFHDVINAAGGLRGLIETLAESPGEEALELLGMARGLANELLEGIQSQRDLFAAERGDLAPRFQEVHVPQLLEQLWASYSHHGVCTGKCLPKPQSTGKPTVHSDPRLLSRVLGNLVKTRWKRRQRAKL